MPGPLRSLDAALTGPCAQYSEGGRAALVALGAALPPRKHLSYAGVPGLSPLARHLCSSVCATGCDDAYCCCADDAHPAKVSPITIADTSFIDRPPFCSTCLKACFRISVGCKIGASRMQDGRKMGVTMTSFLNDIPE